MKLSMEERIKHPQPQMMRETWWDLSGAWDFCEAGETWPEDFPETIQVPYAMESPLSGRGRRHKQGTYLWYRRTLPDIKPAAGRRILFHCGGVDQTAVLFLNGYRMETELDYLHDTVDITDYLQEQNELLLRVWDDEKDMTQPYGKQSAKPKGMWYTPVSGIWQMPWLEEVPDDYIPRLKMIPCEGGITLKLYGGPQEGVVELEDGTTYPVTGGLATICPRKPILWTAENPYLYDFTLRCGEDVIVSYFGIRSLTVKPVADIPRLCVNDTPVFFHGLLDQGYWPDGIYTPRGPEGYRLDIDRIKALGFNMLRKHIKVEPETFYYLCDALGVYVFQDMVNNGPYHFLRDTLFPTLGFQWFPDKHIHTNPESRRLFLLYSHRTVRRLYNHPSIVYWTIFNEGWGQFCSDQIYDRMKNWDDTRFIDTASGWFRCGRSDVDSRHVYFHRFRRPKTKLPLVLSEFGGYAMKISGHTMDEKKQYGYAVYKSKEALSQALGTLYERDVVRHIVPGLCGAVYTQVSDVETEENGLYTYDREICKVEDTTLLDIRRKIDEAMTEVVASTYVTEEV